MHVSETMKRVLPLILSMVLGCREAEFNVRFSEKSASVDRTNPILVTNPAPQVPSVPDSPPDYTAPLVPTPDLSCALGTSFDEVLAMGPEGSSGAISSKTSNIIILLDTSDSMKEELRLLAKALPDFIAALSASLDSSRHRVILHSDAIMSLPGSVYQHKDKVASYDKLLKIEEGLGLISGNRIAEDRLLKNAGTTYHYLLITDEPEDTGDCAPGSRVFFGGVLASYYPLVTPYSWMENERCLIDRHQKNVSDYLKQRGFNHRLHAIHSKTPGSSMWPMLQEGGHPYVELTKAFGGKSFDITNPDWSGILREFADAVVKETLQAGELKNCSLSKLKIQNAMLVQGEKKVALDVLGELTLTQAVDGRGASVQLNAGVLSSKGLDASKPYTISLKTEVIGK